MIVRCVRILGTASGKPLKEHPSIQVGAEYPVLEIIASHHGVKFRIFNPKIDHQHKIVGHALWGAGMFEIVSDRIPSSWTAKVHPNGSLILSLPAWHGEEFWDEFFDGEPAAVAAFERGKDLILNEA
ncbi:hypothetical protein J4573_46165 [Actinomadura barringtoniae]|uniref:Uncharacterized protein n=1 Tax=Actinomadura barringtoniae TaxID=1427535 RepID=A0A939PKE6_9ACTN|nr:hypothetical protein [Actinomadura barringtoniae]MBO2454542.1 hypothetical protein [Actinomadura barringtoniae]